MDFQNKKDDMDAFRIMISNEDDYTNSDEIFLKALRLAKLGYNFDNEIAHLEYFSDVFHKAAMQIFVHNASGSCWSEFYLSQIFILEILESQELFKKNWNKYNLHSPMEINHIC